MAASKEDIITLPNEHLRQRSKRVGLITPEVRQLIADMEASVVDWDSSRDHEVTVALAAIQIDQRIRIIIIRDSFDHHTSASYTAFINPIITKREGEITEDYEGCLSIKSIYGMVPRYNKIRFKATLINGKEIKTKAEGFLARVIQHEIDHTNGTLFIDHIKDRKDAFFELTNEGKLEPLDYDKHIKNSRILW